MRENPPTRILVIPLRFIGDTVLSVPLIRNLRYHYPDATIDILTSRIAGELLLPCPYLNTVIREPGNSREIFSLFRKNRYDQVFLLRKSVTMAFLTKLAGVKNLVGYDKQRWMPPIRYKRWGAFLDRTAVYPSLNTETPQAVNHLSLLDACEIPVQDDYLELWVTENDDASLRKTLKEMKVEFTKPLAILHTVSASVGKTFDIEKFVEPVKLLYRKGFQIICTGVEQDMERYEALKSLLTVPIINMAGKTSLRETFSLYQMAELILTVDSSPIHLAAAAGIPKIIGVFGPTNEKQWGPHRNKAGTSRFFPVFMDLPCRPCYARICEHNSCRVQLQEDDICRAIYQALY